MYCNVAVGFVYRNVVVCSVDYNMSVGLVYCNVVVCSVNYNMSVGFVNRWAMEAEPWNSYKSTMRARWPA